MPNILSALRLLAVPLFVYLFVTERENAAAILFAVAAATDFLDGYLARRLNAYSEIGKLLDPIADRVIIVALAVALVMRDVLPLGLAAAVIARDVLVLILFPALEHKGMPRLTVNFVGKTATAALLFGLGWLALTQTTLPLADNGRDVGIAFSILGAVLYWVAAGMYLKEAVGKMAEIGAGAEVQKAETRTREGE